MRRCVCDDYASTIDSIQASILDTSRVYNFFNVSKAKFLRLKVHVDSIELMCVSLLIKNCRTLLKYSWTRSAICRHPSSVCRSLLHLNIRSLSTLNYMNSLSNFLNSLLIWISLSAFSHFSFRNLILIHSFAKRNKNKNLLKWHVKHNV